METMKAKIDALKTQLASSLTKDSTPEQIKEVEGYKKSLDEIEQKYLKEYFGDKIFFNGGEIL